MESSHASLGAMYVLARSSVVSFTVSRSRFGSVLRDAVAGIETSVRSGLAVLWRTPSPASPEGSSTGLLTQISV